MRYADKKALREGSPSAQDDGTRDTMADWPVHSPNSPGENEGPQVVGFRGPHTPPEVIGLNERDFGQGGVPGGPGH